LKQLPKLKNGNDSRIIYTLVETPSIEQVVSVHKLHFVEFHNLLPFNFLPSVINLRSSFKDWKSDYTVTDY